MFIGSSRIVGTKKWSALVLVSALVGCVPSKTVMLQTTPPGGMLALTKSVNGGPAETVTIAPPDPATNITTQKLEFPKDNPPVYTVTATLDRYRKNSVNIILDQTKDYVIPLTEYKRPIDTVRFEPSHDFRSWVLRPVAGKEMGYLQNLADPNNVVYNEVNITKNPDGSTTDYLNLAASPTADVLVYQKVDPRPVGGGFDTHLFKRTIKSGTETKLTSTRAQEFTPAFTYAGDFIVFSSDSSSENPTLWKIKADGKSTLISHLTATDSADYAASVGQTLIVYTSLPPNALKPEIWRCSLAGVEAGLLTEGTCPQLSPDERQILFLHEDREGINQLWLMDKDGGNLRQVTQTVGFPISDAHWSPDGKWIAYACSQGKDEDNQSNSDIWVISADGSSRNIQMTHNGSCDSSPTWDRSGESIYFRSNRGGVWNIWKLDIRPNVLE